MVGTYDVNVTLDGYVLPVNQTKAVTRDTETTFDFTLTAIPPDQGISNSHLNSGRPKIFINGTDTVISHLIRLPVRWLEPMM